MLFNSLEFLPFFALMLGLMALLAHRVRTRNLVLLAAGYYFYGRWDARFLLLLVFSTLVDYACGILLADRPRPTRGFAEPTGGIDETPVPPDATLPPAGRSRRDTWVLVASIAVNFLFLGFFKYFNFFTDSAVAMLSSMGIKASAPVLKIVLPVGISFYTFQSMSYVIDVYRRVIPVQRNLLHYATYVAFFPPLVAGPIERASHLMPQITRPNVITPEGFYSGFYLICWGLFKKVVISDNIVRISDAVFGTMPLVPHGGGTALIGVYAFAIQIYCDFSGYTDVARGAARCMGFELIRNFNLPYFAVNPSDFWRRWHISLSTWLRDYLYIPLGGNRKGPIRTYFNLMATMVLGGLWHGAAWTYILWGFYHGLLLCLHRALKPLLDRFINPASAAGELAWRIVRIVVMFHLTCAGWLLFRATSVKQIVQFVKAIIGDWNKALGLSLRIDPAIVTPVLMHIFLASAALLLLVQLLQYWKKDSYIVFRLPTPARAVVYASFLLAFLVFGEFGGKPFIYFQF